MFGAETLDHVAFPVRDLPRAEKFYIETVGLVFLTQRKNADGSPRHTYVKAGENIIGLNLPGIQTDPSPSRAPRYRLGYDMVLGGVPQPGAGDAAWCDRALDTIRAREGRLDVLVLNACAPPAVERIGRESAARRAFATSPRAESRFAPRK